jgi:hypothetical protein
VNVKARLLACAAVGLTCAFPAVAGAQAPYAAGPPPAAYPGGPNANGFAAAVPPEQVIASVRAAGFAPLSRPVLRGAVYYMRASRRNVEVRVAIDARSGRVLSAKQLAFDPPPPTGRAGPEAAPVAAPRYEPYVRGGEYSETAPVPRADVPVEGGALPPGRAPGVAAPPPPPPKKLATRPAVQRAPGTSDVTGSVPEPVAAKPAESPPSASPPSAPAPAKPAMLPIAPLE